MTITSESLQALIAGSERATPGPWERKGASVQSTATGYIMETSGAGKYVGSLSSSRGPDQRDIDAGFIAMCDPDTIRSLATELLAAREALAPFAEAFRKHNDPGVSDLDDEQPTSLHVPLGAWRKASALSPKEPSHE